MLIEYLLFSKGTVLALKPERWIVLSLCLQGFHGLVGEIDV